MRTLIGSVLISSILWLAAAPSALAWEERDEQAYHNKMAVLKVMLEGARMRAVETGDLETLCLIMSIGNDVTARYVQLNPGDTKMQKRLNGMKNDIKECFTVLYSKK